MTPLRTKITHFIFKFVGNWTCSSDLVLCRWPYNKHVARFALKLSMSKTQRRFSLQTLPKEWDKWIRKTTPLLFLHSSHPSANPRPASKKTPRNQKPWDFLTPFLGQTLTSLFTGIFSLLQNDFGPQTCMDYSASTTRGHRWTQGQGGKEKQRCDMKRK